MYSYLENGYINYYVRLAANNNAYHRYRLRQWLDTFKVGNSYEILEGVVFSIFFTCQLSYLEVD